MAIRSEGTKGLDKERNRDEAERRIKEDKVEVVVFTDGSATEGRSNGGAVFIAKRKTEEGWKICMVERMAAGEIC